MFNKNCKSLTVAFVAIAVLGAMTFFSSPGAAKEVAATAPIPAAAPAMAIDVAAVMKDRVLGDAKAPVEIIEYASMTCSHCAHFSTAFFPDVKKRLIDTGKARFILRDFPLDQFALKAAMMARCIQADRYYSLAEVVFSNQERWTKNKDPLAGLAQLGALAGMDAESFNACTKNSELETAILNSVQEAQSKYKIRSTPAFIFNNGAETLSGAQPVEKFEALVDKLTKGK